MTTTNTTREIQALEVDIEVLLEQHEAEIQALHEQHEAEIDGWRRVVEILGAEIQVLKEQHL